MLKSVMVYLGLGPDEEYEDTYFGEPQYDDGLDRGDEGLVTTRRVPEDAPRVMSVDSSQPSAVGAVRPLRPVPTVVDDDTEVDLTDGSAAVTDGSQPTVRAIPLQRTKPRILTPQSFGDAKILADEFKRQVPVIMNLRSVDRDLARRLIDFSSGVCYSLTGSMEKLAPQVFLLLPKGVEVSDDERRRIEERGFER